MHKEEFTIIEAESGYKKSFVIRSWSFKMGNNDLCFCGSGKKQKKCHPDVHEKSVIANLYSVFSELDSENLKSQNMPCKKGCSDCCNKHFSISISEFFMILRYLKITPLYADINYYIEKSKEILKNHNIPDNDLMQIKDCPPCIFVDEKDNSCMIYEVRPNICRMYGNVKQLTNCPQILNSVSYGNLINFELFPDTDNNIERFSVGSQILEPKVHPLVYWFQTVNNNFELKSKRMNDLFTCSYERPIHEFIEILLK